MFVFVDIGCIGVNTNSLHGGNTSFTHCSHEAISPVMREGFCFTILEMVK